LSGEETTVGAICNYCFDPTAGWVPEPRNWQELENGSISQRLTEAAITDRLPGKHEDLAVTNFVFKFFCNSLNVAKNLIISEREYISGLPINHLERSISVQRLRVVKSFNEDEILQRLQPLKVYLESNLDQPHNINIDSYAFKNLDDTLICTLSIAWTPNLHEFSLESFERFADIICQAFDEALVDCECENFKKIRDVLQFGAIELRERPRMTRL
jgi:hypothetical protein